MLSKLVIAIVSVILGGLAVVQPSNPWLWFAPLLWGFALCLLNFDDDRSSRAIVTMLKRRDNGQLYTWMVNGLLGLLERLIAPKTAQARPKPAGRLASIFWYVEPRAVDPADLDRLKSSAFSWPVMDAALKLAVIYPLLLLLMQWVLTGQDTGLAGITVLAAEPRDWLRFATLGPIALLLISGILASANLQGVYGKLDKELADFLLWIAVGFAGAVAVGFAGAFVVGFAVAFAIAVAVRFAGAFAVAIAVAITVAGVVAVTGAFAGAALVGLACQARRGRLGYAALAGVLWAALCLAFGLGDPSMDPNDRLFVFAFGMLPLLNAVFDYLSYGTTLALIRRGRRMRDLRTGLVWFADAALGFVYLIGLGLALSGTIALINTLSGTVFIALEPIFDDLRTPEGRETYRWLILAMLSTLLPTLVHLVLAMLSGVTWLPRAFKTRVADAIETGSDLHRLLGSAIAASVATLWITAVAWVTVVGLRWFFLDGVEPYGMFLLRWIEGISRWLGWL